MLARRIQNAIEISCVFCHTTITLDTCSEEKCGQHFVENVSSDKRTKDWNKFFNGAIFESTANYQSRKIEVKFILIRQAMADRFNCPDKRLSVPVIPEFGLDDKSCFWLCDHCSFKGLEDNDRIYKISSVFESKYRIWEKFINKTQPQFYKKCAAKKRKATIASKKAA